MQAVNNEQSIENQDTPQLRISAEIVAYAILLAIAASLLFAGLGNVAMTDSEASQALSAYHAVHNDAPGTPQEASSVIVFWLQRISFTFFGGSEFAARLPGVLSGIVLILMPLLFRKRLGREVTFLMSLTLAFSPIAFTAARFTDPAIWTMIFAIGVLWSAWNYWEMPLQEHALTLAAFLAGLLFLSGASGLVMTLIFVLAAILTVVWTIFTAPEELDSPGDEILGEVGAALRSLPYLPMILMIAGLTLAISTGFLVDTNGLNVVAESLGVALQGFVQPSSDIAPNVFALLSLFIYEPLLVVLAVISVFMMLGSDSDNIADRFVMAWVVVAFFLLLIYRGSVPAQALILVLPLSYLVARLISELLVNYMPSFLSLEAYQSDDPNDYIWIKWTVALVVFAGFIMMSLYLETLGRAMLDFPGTSIPFNTEQQTVLLYARMGWFLIMGILMVVVYFLFSSMWGNRNVLQGYGLGAFAFMLVIGMGTGWNTSVVNINNASELWYTTGITADAYELRETLFDVSRRDTRGFPSIQLVILRDEEAGVTGDGLIAWLVRDFDNARFVDTMGDVRQEEIVLLPQMEEDPDLGGSYVGQSFTIREYWQRGRIGLMDWISWYTQRETRSFVLPEDVTVLWLRIDVYDGIPASERP
mgnify:CR=1 FL=1